VGQQIPSIALHVPTPQSLALLVIAAVATRFTRLRFLIRQLLRKPPAMWSMGQSAIMLLVLLPPPQPISPISCRPPILNCLKSAAEVYAVALSPATFFCPLCPTKRPQIGLSFTSSTLQLEEMDQELGEPSLELSTHLSPQYAWQPQSTRPATTLPEKRTKRASIACKRCVRQDKSIVRCECYGNWWVMDTGVVGFGSSASRNAKRRLA
jgi:hypothetical protein